MDSALLLRLSLKSQGYVGYVLANKPEDVESITTRLAALGVEVQSSDSTTAARVGALIASERLGYLSSWISDVLTQVEAPYSEVQRYLVSRVETWNVLAYLGTRVSHAVTSPEEFGHLGEAFGTALAKDLTLRPDSMLAHHAVRSLAVSSHNFQPLLALHSQLKAGGSARERVGEALAESLDKVVISEIVQKPLDPKLAQALHELTSLYATTLGEENVTQLRRWGDADPRAQISDLQRKVLESGGAGQAVRALEELRSIDPRAATLAMSRYFDTVFPPGQADPEDGISVKTRGMALYVAQYGYAKQLVAQATDASDPRGAERAAQLLVWIDPLVGHGIIRGEIIKAVGSSDPIAQSLLKRVRNTR